MLDNFAVDITGHVKIVSAEDESIVFLDKHNAIHPQNMSRILARALARESNSFINRIAFGNGGTTTDAIGQVILNPVNDGRDGSWESRLYNEVYSEIVDENNTQFKLDLGSAEPGNIRIGGGAVPEDDPAGGGVVSQEVGVKSSVIISCYINKNEPTGQLTSNSDVGGTLDPTEATFAFDEIGLYSPGKQAASTNGYSSIDVGGAVSTDITSLTPSTAYTINIVIDGSALSSTITTPSGGSGPLGEITYGDLAEGINSGAWYTSGDDLSDYCSVFITDRTGGTYPSITGRESYGFLVFESITTGINSNVTLSCLSGSAVDLFAVLTGDICSNVDVNKLDGADAGVINDTITPENERERLLTHIVFPPILKTGDISLKIIYTLTISVARTRDSRVSQITQTGVTD